MSKKSQASKINQSLISKKLSLKQVALQNQKALGITDEGIKNLDHSLHEEYNYSHKGLAKEKQKTEKAEGGLLVESESDRDSNLSSRESEGS